MPTLRLVDHVEGLTRQRRGEAPRASSRTRCAVRSARSSTPERGSRRCGSRRRARSDGLPDRGRERGGEDDDDRQARVPTEAQGAACCWLRATRSAPARSTSSACGPDASARTSSARRPGADPAAVAFDAIEAARARGADVVIIDTAGRLHTQSDLMAELAKVERVVAQAVPGAPHETLLVLDATTGQNAVAQVGLSARRCSYGLVLTKLDSTAKGGIVVALKEEFGPPVKLVGSGEGVDDLEPFDARRVRAGSPDRLSLGDRRVACLPAHVPPSPLDTPGPVPQGRGAEAGRDVRAPGHPHRARPRSTTSPAATRTPAP